MSAPPHVRRAEDREKAIAAEVLTDAFDDEAGLNWWLKQGAAKTRSRRLFFDKAVETLISPKRELWLAQSEMGGAALGAAIWLPPGAPAFQATPIEEVLRLPLFLSIAGWRGVARGSALGAQLAHHHPSAPHAYLAFLGVASAAQGQGIGSALLKQTLAGVDAQKLPAYLEATTERNVALYKRHGFEVMVEFDVPQGGPHFWCMLRPAKS